MSALHDAICLQDIAKLEELIATGADLEVINDTGRTPLCFAVWHRYTDMVAALLAAGANPNTPRTHVGRSVDNCSPLIIAAEEENSTQILKMLIDAGADIDYRQTIRLNCDCDFSALNKAAYLGQWGSVKLLVEAGADMTPPSIITAFPYDYSPLIKAAANGQMDLVELMLERGADIDYACSQCGLDSAFTALHAACRNGAATAIKILCDRGADVNAVSPAEVERTPLHMAALNPARSQAILSTLVTAGDDPFALDSSGCTVTEAMEAMNALAVVGSQHWSEEVLLDSRPVEFD